MAAKLRVCSFVEQQVNKLVEAARTEGSPVTGWLVGTTAGGLHVSSAVRALHFVSGDGEEVDCGREHEELEVLLPGGLQVLGAYADTKGAARRAAWQRLAVAGTGKKAPLVLAVVNGSSISYLLDNDYVDTPVAVTTVEAGGLNKAGLDEEVVAGHMLLRSACPLHLRLFDVGCRRGESIGVAFAAAADELCGATTAFLVSSALLDPVVIGDAAGAGTAQSLGGTFDRPATAAPLIRQTTSSASPSGCIAPLLTYQPVQGGSVATDTVSCQVDLLCYVPKRLASASVAAALLKPALRAQLKEMEVAVRANAGLVGVRALHFRPPGWPHHLTVVYGLPQGDAAAAEQRLQGQRRMLHKRLGLPSDRPLLRVANAVTFGDPAASGAAVGSRLQDVHLTLPPSGVSGGSPHTVSGSYDYYHYMQDKFDDKGWGCAYRSLQTICSWFQRQQYTQAPVPSHAEIQQTLVDLGDKPGRFVGSRQWIGAIELGYILDSRLGVTSKIITVDRGADMPTKAREIARHFDTQGTPIMIGGGVLAYTLLGIDYNERTGECAFLILDPHYTGTDDLKPITSGQWVAWKREGDNAAAGGKLFVHDAFYNLLCPQRPIEL